MSEAETFASNHFSHIKLYFFLFSLHASRSRISVKSKPRRLGCSEVVWRKGLGFRHPNLLGFDFTEILNSRYILVRTFFFSNVIKFTKKNLSKPSNSGTCYNTSNDKENHRRYLPYVVRISPSLVGYFFRRTRIFFCFCRLLRGHYCGDNHRFSLWKLIRDLEFSSHYDVHLCFDCVGN